VILSACTSLLLALPQAGTPTTAGPDAMATWQRVVQAARQPGAASVDPPPLGFEITAEVLVREGVQTNEAHVRHRFLQPDFVRFRLPSGRETGHGPGAGRSGYWLRDGDSVIPLADRSHRADRRAVDEMVSLSRRLLLLANLGQLAVEDVTALPAPPTGLPPSLPVAANSLAWITLRSRAFLPPDRQAAPSQQAGAPTLPLVTLGVDLRTGWVRLALLPDAASPLTDGKRGDLYLLDRHRRVNGFLLPHAIRVYTPRQALPGARGPGQYAQRPAREIWLLRADLRPGLKPQDFRP